MTYIAVQVTWFRLSRDTQWPSSSCSGNNTSSKPECKRRRKRLKFPIPLFFTQVNCMTCQNLISFHSSCHTFTKGFISEDRFHRNARQFVYLHNCICSATCVTLQKENYSNVLNCGDDIAKVCIFKNKAQNKTKIMT